MSTYRIKPNQESLCFNIEQLVAGQWVKVPGRWLTSKDAQAWIDAEGQ